MYHVSFQLTLDPQWPSWEQMKVAVVQASNGIEGC